MSKAFAVINAVAGIGCAIGAVLVPVAGARLGLAIAAVALLATAALLWWLAGALAPLPKAPKFGESMRRATAGMSQATASMQAMSGNLVGDPQITALRATGREAVITIASARDTGTLVNHDPLIEFQLLVQVGDAPPFPITRTELVPKLGLAWRTPGSRFTGFVGTDHQTVLVEWERPLART